MVLINIIGQNEHPKTKQKTSTGHEDEKSDNLDKLGRTYSRLKLRKRYTRISKSICKNQQSEIYMINDMRTTGTFFDTYNNNLLEKSMRIT